MAKFGLVNLLATHDYYTVNDVGGGEFTISNPDGTVVSIQDDGSRQSRVNGTAGDWERWKPVTIDGRAFAKFRYGLFYYEQ